MAPVTASADRDGPKIDFAGGRRGIKDKDIVGLKGAVGCAKSHNLSFLTKPLHAAPYHQPVVPESGLMFWSPGI